MAAAPAGTLGRWPDPDGRRQSVDDRGRGADGSAGAPVGRFLAIAAALLLGVLAAALLLGMPVPSSALAGLTFTVAVGAFAVLMHRRHSHRRLGAANVVTLVRMAIAALLLGLGAALLWASGTHAGASLPAAAGAPHTPTTPHAHPTEETS